MQENIFFDAKIADGTIAHAFFRDIGQPGIDMRLQGGLGYILLVNDHRTAGYLAQTCQALRQLALPISRNTRQADNFTGVDFQIYTRASASVPRSPMACRPSIFRRVSAAACG